jgi:hypothetical protein
LEGRNTSIEWELIDKINSFLLKVLGAACIGGSFKLTDIEHTLLKRT